MKVVSFFAGCGGLDLGFEQAGFRVVWANEFEPHCRVTYLRNHPDTEFVLGDICKIDPNSIPDCDGFIGFKRGRHFNDSFEHRFTINALTHHYSQHLRKHQNDKSVQ